MKVYGFTFIRNAIKFDYPIVEAIKSILPLCDEIIVAVGDSEDDTMQLIKSIDPKVKVIETVWDDDLREGGRTLALETDKAYAAIPKDADLNTFEPVITPTNELLYNFFFVPQEGKYMTKRK